MNGSSKSVLGGLCSQKIMCQRAHSFAVMLDCARRMPFTSQRP